MHRGRRSTGGTEIHRGSDDTDLGRRPSSRAARRARAQRPAFDRAVPTTFARAWHTSGEGDAPGDRRPPAQHNVRTMPVVAVEASIPWANPPNVLGEVDPGAPPIGRRYNGRASNATLPYPRRQPARTWQTRCVHVAGRCVSSGAIAMVVHAYRDVQGYRLTRTAPVARPLMAPVRSHRGHGRERSCAALS